MTTCKIEDSGPTTTITFTSFEEINWRIEAKNFNPLTLPDNEGVVIVFEGQWLEAFTFQYKIKDDDSYPSSGDSCSEKWDAFRTLLKTGGDNEWLFTLTFDKEESIPSVSSTYSLNGKIRNMTKRFVAGKNVNYIEGEFEFYIGDE